VKLQRFFIRHVCVSRSEDVRTANIIAFDPDGVNCLVLEREYVLFVVVISRVKFLKYRLVSYFLLAVMYLTYLQLFSHHWVVVMCQAQQLSQPKVRPWIKIRRRQT
jgi:hypothetical protein